MSDLFSQGNRETFHKHKYPVPIPIPTLSFAVQCSNCGISGSAPLIICGQCFRAKSNLEWIPLNRLLLSYYCNHQIRYCIKRQTVTIVNVKRNPVATLCQVPVITKISHLVFDRTAHKHYYNRHRRVVCVSQSHHYNKSNLRWLGVLQMRCSDPSSRLK